MAASDGRLHLCSAWHHRTICIERTKGEVRRHITNYSLNGWYVCCMHNRSSCVCANRVRLWLKFETDKLELMVVISFIFFLLWGRRHLECVQLVTICLKVACQWFFMLTKSQVHSYRAEQFYDRKLSSRWMRPLKLLVYCLCFSLDALLFTQYKYKFVCVCGVSLSRRNDLRCRGTQMSIYFRWRADHSSSA